MVRTRTHLATGPLSRSATVRRPVVGILMGSDSDWPVMEQAVSTLERFGVSGEVRVLSAHRSPELVRRYASTAASRGLKVIIAGAGGAAHLAGVVAAHTILPVIGVPIDSKSLKGLDSLLSTVQMPNGVPVATVAIDNAANAAILAVQCLALRDHRLEQSLREHKRRLEAGARKADRHLHRSGLRVRGSGPLPSAQSPQPRAQVR